MAHSWTLDSPGFFAGVFGLDPSKLLPVTRRVTGFTGGYSDEVAELCLRATEILHENDNALLSNVRIEVFTNQPPMEPVEIADLLYRMPRKTAGRRVVRPKGARFAPIRLTVSSDELDKLLTSDETDER